MRSSCKVNLVGVDGLLRLDGSHGNYVNSNTNSNTTATVRGRARGKYTSTLRNIYIGKYSAVERAVLYIIVLAQ